MLPASDFSAVLRTYCSASLVAEYESLPTEAREGLLSTLRNAVVGIGSPPGPDPGDLLNSGPLFLRLASLKLRR